MHEIVYSYVLKSSKGYYIYTTVKEDGSPSHRFKWVEEVDDAFLFASAKEVFACRQTLGLTAATIVVVEVVLKRSVSL